MLRIFKDTSKSAYLPRQRMSAIDLNRAGTGLMEIVSEPDMKLVFALVGYIRHSAVLTLRYKIARTSW